MAASVKNSFLERLPAHVDDEHRPYATPKLARSSLRLLLLTLFYLVFLVLGASIFSAIESPGELGLIKSLAATKRDFVSNHYCLSEEELEELLEEVLLAHDRGVSKGLIFSNLMRKDFAWVAEA
ncbi:unnamed protein product [Notodromas monacha]|uniref:Uncharacterized protein n=1 Tax=Notodromas monacha TaxID=399045 RepID=A0A7R9BWA1_9CRUS|nr:unnamed protein product [Notodromas monacha]CAG0921403.1 unnamed protein product [Notodromas monacha]